MKPLRIGIVAESTSLPIRAAISQAARMQADGIQADAVGDLGPANLGETGRREFRNLLRSYNQELAGLTVPLRNGLDAPENLQPRLDHLCKVMELTFDLGARVVVVPCPKIPDEPNSPRGRTMQEALVSLGAHGDRIGVALGLEIGFDPAEKVSQYLASFDTGSLKVTFDPANLLIHGHDPVANLPPLKPYLAHVHARDARAAGVSRGLEEVPLGAGDVDWMTLVATLQVFDFSGFLTVVRHQGENRLRDVAAGVKFLRRFAAPAM
jgi:sugar phosphate isomerase/epimerase